MILPFFRQCNYKCTKKNRYELATLANALVTLKLNHTCGYMLSRVCYIFGSAVRESVQDVTATHLTSQVVSTLRQADHLATQVIAQSGCMDQLSQMPVVLIPVHFDRDPLCRAPSCQRSVVIRPFITQDFMTGADLSGHQAIHNPGLHDRCRS